MPKPVQPSSAREDYLKAIYHLTEGDDRVSTSALAERLGVRDPSVTAMLKRLAAAGLVDYESRQGALLTDEGRVSTMRVVRRHRLLEAFLVEILDLDWSEVHEEAEILEHHLSERIVDAMDHVLGHPFEDPHGHPIPDSEGRIRARQLEPLAALPAGAVATVRELRSDEPERLVRWKQLGLVPGARCKILDRRELDEVLQVRVNGTDCLTGIRALDGVYVEQRA